MSDQPETSLEAEAAEPFEHGVAYADDPGNEPKAKDNPLDSLKPYRPRVTEDMVPFVITGPMERA